MVAVRIKGLKRMKDRHGKRRVYHRATGRPITAPEGSAEFLAEYLRLEALVAQPAPPKPGTLGALIAAYRASSQFTRLKPLTKRDYQRVFDYLKKVDELALIDLKPSIVARIRDRAEERHGYRFANHVRATLSVTCAWGLERDLVEKNPVVGVKAAKRPKDMPRANRPWTDAEREAVLADIPPHMIAPVVLMMFAGLGPKDAIKLPKTGYQGGTIRLHRAKTGQAVSWPLPDIAVEMLERAPRHDAITFCANSIGRPWTVDGFSASFRKIVNRLKAEGKVGDRLTPYGLRHGLAVRLRELGLDDRAIADALGQAEPRMALHYARGADLSRKNAKSAAILNDAMNETATKSVKPFSNNGKPRD